MAPGGAFPYHDLVVAVRRGSCSASCSAMICQLVVGSAVGEALFTVLFILWSWFSLRLVGRVCFFVRGR